MVCSKLEERGQKVLGRNWPEWKRLGMWDRYNPYCCLVESIARSVVVQLAVAMFIDTVLRLYIFRQSRNYKYKVLVHFASVENKPFLACPSNPQWNSGEVSHNANTG